MACINEESLVVKQGIVEPSLVNIELSVPVQFERTGYFCKDKDSQAGKLVFNRAVGLRDTWAKMDQA
jgi:glutaminyl-tRNA synthetase